MKVYSIGMYEGLLDYLQYVVYHANTCKDILGDILINKTPGYTHNIDNYHHFMSGFRDAKIKYEFEYLDFLMNYLPEFFGDASYEVYFDFINGKIEFNEIQNEYTELVTKIELEETDDLELLRFLSIEKLSYEEILNDVIRKRNIDQHLNMETYNVFIKEYNEILNQYDNLFRKILTDYAPEYRSNDFYAIININYMTLEIYRNC